MTIHGGVFSFKKTRSMASQAVSWGFSNKKGHKRPEGPAQRVLRNIAGGVLPQAENSRQTITLAAPNLPKPVPRPRFSQLDSAKDSLMSRLQPSSLRTALILTALCTSPALAAGVGTGSTFSAPQLNATPGQTVTVPVLLNNGTGEIQGWSMGLGVPLPLEVVAVSDGSTTLAFNGGAGPDFNHIAGYPGEGAGSGVVISFMGVESLPPGTGYELHLIDVLVPASATPGTVYPLTFIETIGDPDIVNIVVVGGASITPAFVHGSITVTFESYCHCDGSGVSAPCANTGGSGEGCANSTGSGARLTGSGSSSVAADDLGFRASGMVPGQPALLFSGLSAPNGGLGVFFGDGLRCAGNSVRRLAVSFIGSSGIAQWPPSLATAGGWAAGDTRHFQGWYRDPFMSPCGSGFNLTQGVRITFQP